MSDITTMDNGPGEVIQALPVVAAVILPGQLSEPEQGNSGAAWHNQAIPVWETVATNGRDATQRLAVPGGYIYRTTWEHRGPLGFGASVHAVATFVPGG